MSEEQIRAAYPKSTQTIEIEAFVQASENMLPAKGEPMAELAPLRD